MIENSLVSSDENVFNYFISILISQELVNLHTCVQTYEIYLGVIQLNSNTALPVRDVNTLIYLYDLHHT